MSFHPESESLWEDAKTKLQDACFKNNEILFDVHQARMKVRDMFVLLGFELWVKRDKLDELKAAFERWMTRIYRPFQVVRQTRLIPSNFQCTETKFPTLKTSPKFHNNPVPFDRIHPKFHGFHRHIQFQFEQFAAHLFEAGQAHRERRTAEKLNERGTKMFVRCDVVCSFKRCRSPCLRHRAAVDEAKPQHTFCVIWRRLNSGAIRNTWLAARLSRRWRHTTHHEFIRRAIDCNLPAAAAHPPSSFESLNHTSLCCRNSCEHFSAPFSVNYVKRRKWNISHVP